MLLSQLSEVEQYTPAEHFLTAIIFVLFIGAIVLIFYAFLQYYDSEKHMIAEKSRTKNKLQLLDKQINKLQLEQQQQK